MTARTEGFEDFRAPDVHRRMNNMIRVTKVLETNPAKGLVRVESGKLKSDWIPAVTARAGGDRSWHFFEKGEQVMIFSPTGDMRQAVCLGAVYCEQYPAPAKSDDVSRTVYKDGTVVEYDRKIHVLRVKSPQLIKVVAESQMVISGDVYIDGNLEVTGTIRAENQIVSKVGVWPPRPAVVPKMTENTTDSGVAE